MSDSNISVTQGVMILVVTVIAIALSYGAYTYMGAASTPLWQMIVSFAIFFAMWFFVARGIYVWE